MSVQEIFEILGIGPTRDEESIRAAYRSRLTSVNPEDDPQGFMRLRGAYEEAVKYARTPEGEAVNSALWMEELGPEGEFLRRLADVYGCLPRRLDEAEWSGLLREPVLASLDGGEQAKWGLFSFLAEHYRLPGRIWKILGETFGIEENAEEFKERLPEPFVEYMLRRIQDDEEGDFPLEKLSGEPQADYDGFMQLFFNLTNRERGDSPEQLREVGEILEQLKQFGISHPWYELEQADYLSRIGETQRAAEMVRGLIRENPEDDRVYMSGAFILGVCGCGDEAGELYVGYLKRNNQTVRGTYTALLSLARMAVIREDWKSVRELAGMADDLRSTDATEELMKQADDALIDGLTGEEQLTEEQVLLLAGCFVHGKRTGEGIEFFESHPELVPDRADFYEQMALMYREEERYWESMEAVKSWRSCLDRDAGGAEGLAGPENTAGSAKNLRSMAASLDLEGRLWRDIYYEEKRAGKLPPEMAEELSGRALAACSRAIGLEPENLDFRLHQVLVLKDRNAWEEAAGQCREIISMDDEAYWAYFYLQEICEELGQDQEVVNLFGRMIKIYPGHPEVYLRALRVFKRYGRYEAALDVIRRAEQAEVKSGELLVEKIGVLDQLAEDEKDWKRADRFAANVIGWLKKSKAPRWLLAQAYLKRSFLNDSGGKHNQSKKLGLDRVYAEESLRLNDSLSARYALGRYWIEYGGRPKMAYLHLKICEKRGMDYDRLCYYIARCHERFRQWNKAIAYYQQALEKNPEFSGCYWRLGLLYKQKFCRVCQPEYAEKALYYINLYDEKFGESAESFRRRADIYLRMGEYDKALKEIEEGVKQDGDSDMWLLRGKVLRAMRRYEEAIGSCEKSMTAEDLFGKDDEECFKRVFQCFLRMGQLERGAAYLENALDKDIDEDGREKCLESLTYLEATAGRYDRALDWISERYGSADLTRRCCDDWEREAERMEEVLDIWLRFRENPGEEILEKCTQAAALADLAYADSGKDPEGRALACQNAGEAYCRLGQYDTAIGYLKNAWELACQCKKYGYYRSLTRKLMETYYWLGDLEEARAFGDLYRKRMESVYEECDDLGMSVEELMTRPNMESRQTLYNLFCWAYYTGRGDQARRYIGLMEQRDMCWWCDEDGCTEFWEARGLLAMLDGSVEEALAAFRKANQVIWLGINKDACAAIARLLEESKET